MLRQQSAATLRFDAGFTFLLAETEYYCSPLETEIRVWGVPDDTFDPSVQFVLTPSRV